MARSGFFSATYPALASAAILDRCLEPDPARRATLPELRAVFMELSPVDPKTYTPFGDEEEAGAAAGLRAGPNREDDDE